MSRPRKIEEAKRKKKIIIRLNDDEEKLLHEKVKQSGLTKSDFIRTSTLNSKPRLRPVTPERIAFIKGLSELGKIGSNVNQIAKVLNTQKLRGEAMTIHPDLLASVLYGLQTLSCHLIKTLTDDNTR